MKVLQNILNWIYPIMMCCILIVVTCFYKLSNFVLAQNFLISAPVCILIAATLIFLVTIWYTRRIQGASGLYLKLKHNRNFIVLSTPPLTLFLLQLFTFWNSYFLTSWDVQILTDNAYRISNNDLSLLSHSYFSRCPNNLLLESLFVHIFKFAKLIGITSLQNDVFLLIILQCVLSGISGILLFKILQHITGNMITAWLGWTLFLLLAGTSPWLMIPYSDAMCLIFPILILWLWITLENRKYLPLKWSLIASVSFIGYRLKPQTVIPLIAILIVEFLFSNFKFDKEKIARLLRCAVPAILSVIILHFSVLHITSALPFQLNKNAAFGMTHYFMQGLNEKTQGQYSADDVRFSAGLSTPQERSKANLEEAAKRLKKLGFSGTARLALTKTSSNYANGVFGWSQEGGRYFYRQTFPDKSPASPFFKNILYFNGKYYRFFAVIKQIVWFAVLILSVFSLIGKNNRQKKPLMIVSLTIIGLTVFETLFESRARYLYAFVPLYALLASVGWQNIVRRISAPRRLFRRAGQ